MIVETCEFEWCSIRISLKHERKYGGLIEHLEIRTIDPEKAPLPITDTGYKSHFVDEKHIDHYGGSQAYVVAWLDEEASKPKWQRQKDVANQYSLF